MYVRMCEHCEVCACDLVSYVIIQAYVYLADEIILLNTEKGKCENALAHTRLAGFDWQIYCVFHALVMSARRTHPRHAKQLLLESERETRRERK